jgi:hypothetical protein
MTSEEREKMVLEIIQNELLPVLRAKGHDYSGKDVLSNFRDFGLLGIVVRIGDKYHRLKNIMLQGRRMVEDETIEDTLKDLINYGLIALIYKRAGGK